MLALELSLSNRGISTLLGDDGSCAGFVSRSVAPPGVTYSMAGVVYVALTNDCNACLTMLEANGPGFEFPAGTDFQALPDGLEPSGQQAAQAALQACRDLDKVGKAGADERGGREVVFAGLGEPLMRRAALVAAIGSLVGRSEVRATRLNTNGLVPASDAMAVAQELKAAGLGRVCVQLQTADAAQHEKLVRPFGATGHADVCAFVAALAKVGLPVDCSAVARPGVDLEATRKLALQLGANSFLVRPFFPEE